MSTLIRSNDLGRGASIRTLEPAPIRPREAPIDPELAALRVEVERLRDAMERQEEAIAGHAGALEKAYDQGKADGREAGLTEADDGRRALTAQITAATERALKQFADEIASLERLAPLLATDGLERILGSSLERADMVRAIVRRQLAGLEAQAVIRVEVSTTDFPQPEQLPHTPGAEVTASDELKSGDCRIRLQLGGLDVGVDQQWTRLREILAELAEPRSRP